jgi:hypothetical protein
MSREGMDYNNPLDSFRSHSTQYILTAANTSEAFRNSIGSGNGKQSKLLTAIEGKKIGDPIDLNGDKVFLLIDSRRYSQYSITDLEFTHGYGMGTLLNPTTVYGSTTMKIIDSTGLSFFTLLMDVGRNQFQSAAGTIYFMLTIIFTGHKDDNSTETISTCYIPLNLLDMTFELTSAGSTYDLQFVEIDGLAVGAGAVRSDNLGQIKTVTTEKGNNTIGSLIDSLEYQLNIKSLEYYQNYSNTSLTNTNSKSKTPFGRLVQYMITVPDDIRGFKIDAGTRAVNEESKFLAKKQMGTKNEEAKKEVGISAVNTTAQSSSVSFNPDTTITAAILSILELSKDFLKLAGEKNREGGSAKVFKTSCSSTSDSVTHVLHFDVIQNSVPVFKKPEPKTPNVIDYNYIFTGKNSHIIDFKINFNHISLLALESTLEIGQNRMSAVSAAGQKTKDVEQVSVGAHQTSEAAYHLRASDPIFLPMLTKDQKSNNGGQKNEALKKEDAVDLLKAKQEYTKTYAVLNFQAAAGGANLTVRGNPNIIRKYADRNERGGVPPHMSIISAPALNALINNGQKKAVQNYDSFIKAGLNSAKAYYVSTYLKPKAQTASNPTFTNDEILNGVDPASYPVFVNLNIKAPNVDYSGNFISDQPMYTNDFTYNGLYKILTIKTTISSGAMQHQMSLVPYNPDGTYVKSDVSSTPPRKTI